MPTSDATGIQAEPATSAQPASAAMNPTYCGFRGNR